MAKSRLELITTEIDQVTEIIEQQFIERDICMVLEQLPEVEVVNDEIRLFMRRKDALLQLLDAEKQKEATHETNTT
jgi:hypothetical protein